MTLFVRICFLLVTLSLVTLALANDTSLHDGRSGPEPLGLDGRESPVRMMAEHLEIGFGYRNTEVHCTFTFRNTGSDQSVEGMVGFPDIGAALDEALRRKADPVLAETVNTTRLRHLVTRVNGRKVRSDLRFGPLDQRRGTGSYSIWMRSEKTGLCAWHTVAVTFPPGEDVTIERSYTVQNGASAAGVAFFSYTTATGGVWRGTIGKLEADVTLRDGLTVEQLVWTGDKKRGEVLPAELGTSPARTQWQVIDPTHLRLVWKDFEPRTEATHRGFTLARDFHGW